MKSSASQPDRQEAFDSLSLKIVQMYGRAHKRNRTQHHAPRDNPVTTGIIAVFFVSHSAAAGIIMDSHGWIEAKGGAVK